MSDPISGNGYKIVTINMGALNCVGEPYVVEVGENCKFILRYEHSIKDGDYGKLILEAMAK